MHNIDLHLIPCFGTRHSIYFNYLVWSVIWIYVVLYIFNRGFVFIQVQHDYMIYILYR
jgi:hypothetical protein